MTSNSNPSLTEAIASSFKDVTHSYKRQENYLKRMKEFYEKDRKDARDRRINAIGSPHLFLIISLLILFTVLIISLKSSQENRITLMQTMITIAVLAVALSGMYLSYKLIVSTQKNSFARRLEGSC